MTTEPFLKLAPRARLASRIGPSIRRDATGLSLYALRAYAADDVVLEFRDALWRLDRDRFTVEHSSGAHLYHPLLAMAAHSCAPNGRIDVRQRTLVAVHSIAKGDRVTIDYKATERRISQPFDCLCGAAGCRKRIS